MAFFQAMLLLWCVAPAVAQASAGNGHATGSGESRAVAPVPGGTILRDRASGHAGDLKLLLDIGVTCALLTLSGAPHKLADWERSVPDYAARPITWLRSTLDVPTSMTAVPLTLPPG